MAIGKQSLKRAARAGNAKNTTSKFIAKPDKAIEEQIMKENKTVSFTQEMPIHLL